MGRVIKELSGISKVCGRCEKECKQWKQLTVVVCPNYSPKNVELDAKNDTLEVYA